MSGLINSAGSKSGVIGEMGLGVAAASHFQLAANHTADGVITNWNDAGNLDGAGTVGKKIPVSSGIFTLPSGVWLIVAGFHCNATAGDNWIDVNLQTGSGTTLVSRTTGDAGGYGYTKGGYIGINHIVHSSSATSTTFKFQAGSISGGSFIGGDGVWSSGAIGSIASFIQLSSITSSSA